MFSLKIWLIRTYVEWVGTWTYFLCIFFVGFLLLPGYLLTLFLVRRWLLSKIKKYSNYEEENEDRLRDLWFTFYKTNPGDSLLEKLSSIPLYEDYVEGIKERMSEDLSAAMRY